MNQTTEDSKKIATLVGGDTIVKEDGKLESPPEQAKNAQNVLNTIFEGMFQEIKVENCNIKDMNFTAEQKEEFNEWELKNKTKSRFGTLEENIQILIDEGFIEKTKYTKYKLLKNKWQ